MNPNPLLFRRVPGAPNRLVFEWITVLILAGIVGLIELFSQPHCREFTLVPPDPTIDHPMHADTFPVWSLFPVVALPIFIYAALWKWAPAETSPQFKTLFGVSRRHREPGTPTCGAAELNAYFLMQVTSAVLAMFLTNCVKDYAGRLRPDFISRLKKEPSCNATLASLAIECCLDNPIMKDGRRSFPSGHSSMSFAGIMPLCLMLAWRLQPIRTGSPLMLLISWIPVSLPIVVAVSRTVNNRHHFTDIAVGSAIGIICAFVAFRMMLSQLRYLFGECRNEDVILPDVEQPNPSPPPPAPGNAGSDRADRQGTQTSLATIEA